MFDRLKDWARRIKRDVIALAIAARHPGVPWHARVLAIAVTAYALSLIDLIPDFRAGARLPGRRRDRPGRHRAGYPTDPAGSDVRLRHAVSRLRELPGRYCRLCRKTPEARRAL